MLGLFGTLNLGARALQAQQQGIETAGHNLANVNTTGYARQRVNLQTSSAIPSSFGPIGTGVDVAGIQQLRDAILDGQVQSENSVTSFLAAKQAALQYAEAALGQQIDRSASGAEGAAAANGSGGQHGIADQLSGFFNAFQALAADPSSPTARKAVLSKAQDLAGLFNQISSGLASLHASLNDSINSDTDSANNLLASIADLNKQIITTETGNPGSANDLRDLRQQKIEQLSNLVNIQTTAQTNGGVDISISGVTMVSGTQVKDTLQTYDAGGGQILLRGASSGTPLTLSSGSIQGTIDARDGAMKDLSDNLDVLASQLVTEVNNIHQTGYGLNGSTGAAFFVGTNAATIQVNAALVGDPALLQAAGVPGAAGDNKVALALAQLANKKIAGLSNQTLSDQFGTTVASLGQAISSTSSNISDQQLVSKMLQQQRDSVSGVSLDEEMTDMMKYQKAYEASAHLITTLDQMLETVLTMKQ